MNGLNIKTKIILATTLVLAVVFVAFSLVIYQAVERAYVGRVDARLEGYAETFREEVEEQEGEGRFPSFADFNALHTSVLSGSLIRLTDPNGIPVYVDSTLNAQPRLPKNEVTSGQFTFDDMVVDEIQYRSLWTLIGTGKYDRYMVQIALPMTEVEASLKLLQLLFLIGVPVVLVVSAIAVYGIVLNSFKPLSAMARTAKSISAANLRERVPVPSTHDEVFDLASTLNTMMDRLEQAFKSQRQFIADASHEIRTPLAIIRSELEFARKQTTQSETEASLDIALGELDRLKTLAEELLLLAKLDSATLVLKKDIVRLDELLADSVRRMKPIADVKGVLLFLTLHNAVEIEGDEEKLRSTILNLLDNAIKYSRNGGKVEVTTRSTEGNIEVTVQDHGEGIPPNEIGHVFERFHRAVSNNSEREGSGLGLAIAQKIVEMHGGSITMESREGEGSTFTLILPGL